MATNRPKFKCYDCADYFKSLEDLYRHIEEDHPDVIPEGFTTARYYYMRKTGKTSGKCIMCKRPTDWNDSTNKYNRFCNRPACKAKYREEFKKRMIGKYGKVHLLDDPTKQREMLANRAISGNYKWSDGTLKTYTGSYEKKALEYEDIILNMKSADVMSPSPHNYVYTYEGKEHFYFPDQYLVNLNAEIEIKDGGNNPNMHPKIQLVDKAKEKLKDDVMRSQNSINYLKLTNNNMDLLIKFIDTIKTISVSDNPNRRVIMIENEVNIVDSKTKILAESYAPDYEMTEGDTLLIECIKNHLKYDDSNKDLVCSLDKDLLEDIVRGDDTK